MRARSKELCKPLFIKNNIKASKSRQNLYKCNKIIKPSNANQILKNHTIMSTPPSDIKQSLGLHRSISSSYSPYEYKPIEELPPLNSATEDTFNDLLRKKLKQCCRICNFTSAMADLKSKNLKAIFLKEILSFISEQNSFERMEPKTVDYLFKMLKCNIIRAIPPTNSLAKMPIIGDNVNDTIYESSWRHLEIVYHIFQQFLDFEAMDTTQFTQYIDSKFIHQFLMVFNAPDKRERYELKMILHKLYLRFFQQRFIIRKAIHHVFYTYLYETKYFCGINELLEIISSIINGYFVPLRQEHKDFLVKLLLPLYTSNHLHVFQANLLNCVLQYIHKDHLLITIIIKKLLSFWPISCTMKEICFINHIDKILEQISDIQFVKIMVPLFHRIGKCITSKNFQVCEVSMLLWKNDRFIELTIFHSDVLFPIICPYLYQTGAQHWNTSIKNLAVSIIRIFMELSRDVFESFSRSMKIRELKNNQNFIDRKNNWLAIINTAASIDNNINESEKMNELDDIYAEMQKTKVK